MNFYASPEYLDVVAEVYFKGRRTNVEDVRIDDEVLRLLVVDDKNVITSVRYLDYHQPLLPNEIRAPARTFNYAEKVVRRVIGSAEWDAKAFERFEPAPYVDWSTFPTYDAYWAHLMTRNKGLLKDHERRRRRLADAVGNVEFCMDDEREDVFELARQWKSQQCRDIGVTDFFAQPENVEYFHVLRRKGLLTSSTLRAGGRLVSIWMGFVYDGVWSGWIFTFNQDPELRKFSLGHQLLHSMLQESHRQKHREFDFSIGGEDYKWVYATHARLVGTIGRAPLRHRILLGTRRVAKRAVGDPRIRKRLRRIALALRISQ